MSNSVTIYADANFQGASKQLGVGNHDLPDLSPVGNDSISSIRIPAGLQVMVYDNAGFGGPSKLFTADVSFLADWNDRVSSLQVIQIPVQAPAPAPQATPQAPVWTHTTTDKVTVYADAHYQGKSQQFGPGMYDVGALNVVGNDSISSILVPSSLVIDIFSDAGFGGKKYPLNFSVDDLKTLGDMSDSWTWNDQISSLVVYMVSPSYQTNLPAWQQDNALKGAAITSGAKIYEGNFGWLQMK